MTQRHFHRRRPATLRVLSLVLLAAPPLIASPTAAQEAAHETAEQPHDPFLWLEEVEGERALAWVEEQSERTLETFRAEPLFDSIFRESLEILSSDERIAYPSIMGGRLYNFWQDDEHERGIWRRTAWESYLSREPEWETVLDIDALAAREGVPWAWSGAECLAPAYERCMVHLSRGGADATEVREFDLRTGTFVEDGFFLPESKGSVTWRDRDALLVSTDFGEGTMTTSGYPRIARLWRRGTELNDAETLFEGERDDVAVWVGSMETAHETYEVVTHSPSFFESVTYVVTDGGDDGLVELDLPRDADPRLVGDQLVVYLRSPWEVGGTTFVEGSVIATDFTSFLSGGRDFAVVVGPGRRTTIQGVRTTRDHVLVTLLDDVHGRLRRYAFDGGRWVGEEVPLPDWGSVRVRSTSPHTNRYFFTYSSFTQPTTLYLDDDEEVREVRRMPAMFDATGLVVEQHRATSADGTRVPYFVVHREGMPSDGSNPTLLYAYGGFQISVTPGYSATVGRAWLERGGVYVVANIRGGGEFGPGWWRAAQKENRQRAYDDFLAVAEDLIERGITSPDHLGIRGGSNGGLLVGVAMTQRPDLFDAVVVAVPLLDMRRYNRLLAGASWMAEYGNPDVPEQWAYIREYSPYHNVEPDADYPRALIYTTTRDDRVHPAHARKMAAKMLAMGHPVHYWENTEGGHGSGVTPEQRARMQALVYTYLWERLDAEAGRASPEADAAGPATGTGGMVSSAHPLATEAGLDVLRRGGTAFDAAVAVAAALSVVEPMMSGMGGYGTILVYSADEGRSRFLNPSGRIPRGTDPDAYRPPTPGYMQNRRGAKAVSTPGNVNAWAAMWQDYGRLEWAALLEPAARLAEEGFVLDERTAAMIAWAYEDFPAHAREIYGSDGAPLETGQRLVQADLARSLRLVADEGPEAFHGGELGRAVDRAMREAGGFLRLSDLVENEAEWWEPISVAYRGHEVVTASPPANSFPALVRLGLMSRFDVRELGHNTADHLHLYAEATKHAFWTRLRWAGDPEVRPPPLDVLLSEAYWAGVAATFHPERARAFEPPEAVVAAQETNTTHFVVADRWGNVVSATQTLGNLFGARIMPEGTGIWLNNSLAYSTFEPAGNPMDAHPGRRKLSGDVPLFVMRDGRPWIAAGTPGGHTIAQTMPQIVMNAVDFGMDIRRAIAAPRVAFVEPDALAVEGTLAPDVLRELQMRGHELRLVEGIGNAHGLTVEWGADGRPVRFTGAADPRGMGLARGLR